MDTNLPSRTSSIDQSIDFPITLFSVVQCILDHFLSEIDAGSEKEFARAINIGSSLTNDRYPDSYHFEVFRC